MNIFVVALSVGMIVGVAGCSRSAQDDPHSVAGHNLSKSADTQQKEFYTCPMHPSVVSDKPGACPICGMSLVKRSAKQDAPEGNVENLKEVSLSPSQRVMANVSTEPARFRTFVYTIGAVGVVDYAEPSQATVAARFRGRIERLHVNFTGAIVRKGQPLFDMYSPDLVSAQRDLVVALNSLAPSQVPGSDSLYNTQQEAMVYAARERLRVHYGMTSGQIETIASTRQTRSTVTFTSPIDGTVLAKEVQEGQYVDEGMILYQLADLSRVWAYLEVYEKDFRFIKRGQAVTLTSDAIAGETFSGRIAFIDPMVNPESRTARVRVELANMEGKLKPQMYVDAAVRIPVEKSLVIPATALLSTGKRDIVWVETKPNTFEPREVVKGLTDGSMVQILRGLEEGATVAISGGFLIDSESQLQQPVRPDTELQTHTAPAAERKPAGRHVHD